MLLMSTWSHCPATQWDYFVLRGMTCLPNFTPKIIVMYMCLTLNQELKAEKQTKSVKHTWLM